MTETPLETLLHGRRSVRAYKPEPVPREDVEHILRAARQAPSGANLQPGKFHALSGAPFEGLRLALAQALADGTAPVSEYTYFPSPMPTDLKARQRAAGYALYKALGIEKRDLAGRRAQFERNYDFFGAPVGIVVTINRDMGAGCFMDLGMALMALFLAAEELGYGATGIGALANYAPTVHRHLDLPEGEMVVCGIALGRTETSDPVNSVRTERDALDVYTSFRGFD